MSAEAGAGDDAGAGAGAGGGRKVASLTNTLPPSLPAAAAPSVSSSEDRAEPGGGASALAAAKEKIDGVGVSQQSLIKKIVCIMLHCPCTLTHLSASPCCAWGSIAASRPMSARTKASCRSKGTVAKGGTCRKTQACVCVRVMGD